MKWLQPRIIAATASLAFFCYIQVFVWKDSEQYVDLLKWSFYEYTLIWLWISLIAIVIAADFYRSDTHPQGPVWPIICVWWTANIGAIQWLESVKHRPIGGAAEVLWPVSGNMDGILRFLNADMYSIGGEMMWRLPAIALDPVVFAPMDSAALLAVLLLVVFRKMEISIWTLFFCIFLLANLTGHAIAAFQLKAGVDPAAVGQFYDPYLYLAFTVMLLIQVVGSGGDALFRKMGSHVDLYTDLRPYFRRLASRHFHLS